MFMKISLIIPFLLITSLTSCWIPGRELTQAEFIQESNASPVQKRAMWEGCMAANTRENAPTSIRDLAEVSLDGDMASNGEYKTAFSYGYYYCHLYKSLYSRDYIGKGQNMIGFKGDNISYKSGM